MRNSAARVRIEDDPVVAEDTIMEFDDVELDDTGKRERGSRREPPKRSKKVSIYQSAAAVLVRNPSIANEALAVKAAMAPASAERCRVAWRDILAALDAAGCLTQRGKRLRGE